MFSYVCMFFCVCMCPHACVQTLAHVHHVLMIFLSNMMSLCCPLILEVYTLLCMKSASRHICKDKYVALLWLLVCEIWCLLNLSGDAVCHSAMHEMHVGMRVSAGAIGKVIEGWYKGPWFDSGPSTQFCPGFLRSEFSKKNHGDDVCKHKYVALTWWCMTN